MCPDALPFVSSGGSVAPTAQSFLDESNFLGLDNFIFQANRLDVDVSAIKSPRQKPVTKAGARVSTQLEECSKA